MASHIQDTSQAYRLYITVCTLLVVLVSTTTLRVWSRLRYFGMLTVDDGLIVLGTCLNIVADGMQLHAIEKGFGRHTKFLPLDALVQALKYMQLSVLMAGLSTWSIKVSVCFFLLSLLRDVHKHFRAFIWGLMAFTTISTFIALLLWGLQAHPLDRLWDPRVKGTRGSSEDFLKVVYIFYASNLFTDIIYSLTPVWFLWNVQISKRQKYAIWALMGAALLLTVVVVMCIVFAPQFLEKEDLTWALVPMVIADCTQRHVSGIVANLPSLYTLATRISSVRSSTTASSSTNQSGGCLKRFQLRSSLAKGSTARSNHESLTLENVQHSAPYSLVTETDDRIPLRGEGLTPAGD